MNNHTWLETKDMDHRKRLCYYCPCCGAIVLLDETEYKEQLDKKGCNQLNRDFDEIFMVRYIADYNKTTRKFNIERVSTPYATTLTLAGAIEMASDATETGYPNVFIANETGDVISLDISLLLQ